ncbi:MAG: hypothetical protein ABEJ05_02465 [Haloglomus sp.]
MTADWPTTGRTGVAERVSNLQAALADLVGQELSLSNGYVAALLNGCLFAPSLLTFWFVNGVIDFSTAVLIGSVVSPAGLQLRLYAYLLLVPVFFLLRVTLHLVHPTHRRQVLSGSCPRTEVLSLDWFSVGILATGLPIALQDLGPWLGTNAVLLFGVLVVPSATSGRTAAASKFVAVVVGPLLFLYATYGAAVAFLPAPATTLGPLATLTLSDATTTILLRTANSFLLGPVFVAGFGVAMNHVLTHPEVRSIPLLRRTLPRRDPDRVVVTSAALGTLFYLCVVLAFTGELVVFP